MPPTVYLVSGASRGIGLALVKALVARADVVVFAGARQSGSATDLQALAAAHPGKLHVVELASADEAGNRAAVAEIERVAGRLDVVIANAAIAEWSGPALEAPLAALREHFEVNTLGVLALFQAAYPLLARSTPTPKFVPISSGAGSVALGPTFPTQTLPYGVSKAALNFVARKLRAENAALVCFPICPGAVATDMGTASAARASRAAEAAGGGAPPQAKFAFRSPDAVANDILARVDEGTRETDAFVRAEGGAWSW